MSDYISREDAIRWVKTECNPYGKPTLDYESGIRVMVHLKHMPSADVVQVVRCDDCKYYGSRRWCELHSSVFDDNAFCSYGEREE